MRYHAMQNEETLTVTHSSKNTHDMIIQSFMFIVGTVDVTL